MGNNNNNNHTPKIKNVDSKKEKKSANKIYLLSRAVSIEYCKRNSTYWNKSVIFVLKTLHKIHHVQTTKETI